MMFSVAMIADHQRKVAMQLSVPLPVQQVHQAVVVFGNEDCHPWPLAAQRDAPFHSKFVRDRPERPIKILQPQPESFEAPFHARQVEAFFASLVLFEMENVSIVSINEIRYRRIQSLAVRALYQ
jgi:hypothetical protein